MSGGIVVPLEPFRAALQAVRPFVHAKDKSGKFSMVRLAPGHVMHVMATDGFSAAIARVPISQRDTDEAGFIDLRLPDVAALLSVFRMPADENEQFDAAVQIVSDGREVVFTDVSGLIDGDSLTLQLSVSDMPDFRPTIRARLHPSGHLRPDYPRFGLHSPQAKRLDAAMRAYGTWATFHGEPSRRSSDKDRLDALVTIGEHFAATMTLPSTPPAESAWRYRWDRELVGVGESDRARSNTTVEMTWGGRTVVVGLNDLTQAADFVRGAVAEELEEPMDGQEELDLDQETDEDAGNPDFDGDDMGGYSLTANKGKDQ